LISNTLRYQIGDQEILSNKDYLFEHGVRKNKQDEKYVKSNKRAGCNKQAWWNKISEMNK